MRKSLFTIALILGLNAAPALAQGTTVSVKVPNFARPLVERWITEYRKTTNDIDFQLGNSQADHQLSFVVAEEVTAPGTPTTTVYVGRYAILPVTSKSSEAQQLLAKRKLNSKNLKKLFFVKDELSEEKDSKLEQALHIYTGNGRQSVARSYAAHFGQVATDFKGKRISGDDSFLNVAIGKDPYGVAINTLSNVFDLGSRQLRSDLSLVPLDLDKHAKDVYSDEASLDDLIAVLETQRIDEIPVERVGFAFNKTDDVLNRFVKWVLTEGKTYVHEYGLLNLSQKELAAELKHVESKDIAQK